MMKGVMKTHPHQKNKANDVSADAATVISANMISFSAEPTPLHPQWDQKAALANQPAPALPAHTFVSATGGVALQL